MEDTFCWEIDNFTEKNDGIITQNFSSGGYHGSDHLSLFLHVVNPDSLRLGWKRRASYYFKSKESLFCNEMSSWGYAKTLPISKLQEKGFLKKNKLFIQIYIKVLEVVHQGNSTENEMIDYCGFQISLSQIALLNDNVLYHPDFAVDFKPENQAVKTKYRNLLRIIETLSKPPQSLSLAVLRKAQSELAALEEADFKLDWLNSKIEELSAECKKVTFSDVQLEDRVKNVELTLWDLKAELDKEKIKSAAAASADAASSILS
ncbi:hypothetical protein Bca52824_079697 [Brassica carinata]|uniref:MATH domain-containing protein n=1 Tax=Brassica carinata TaxID=52824 RepID=A0A8X7Q1Q1_BRACI|nr:hypothetical protein Bca52824_079697 [Brassica carinata]